MYITTASINRSVHYYYFHKQRHMEAERGQSPAAAIAHRHNDEEHQFVPTPPKVQTMFTDRSKYTALHCTSPFFPTLKLMSVTENTHLGVFTSGSPSEGSTVPSTFAVFKSVWKREL